MSRSMELLVISADVSFRSVPSTASSFSDVASVSSVTILTRSVSVLLCTVTLRTTSTSSKPRASACWQRYETRRSAKRKTDNVKRTIYTRPLFQYILIDFPASYCVLWRSPEATTSILMTIKEHIIRMNNDHYIITSSRRGSI